MNTSDNNTNLSIIKQTFSEALQTFGLIMLSISIIKSEKEVILYFLFPLATGLIYRLIKKQVSDKKAQCITLQSERKIHEEGNYPISTEQSEASIQHEH